MALVSEGVLADVGSAVMCMLVVDDVIIIGSAQGSINMFDAQSGTSHSVRFKKHVGAVTCIECDGQRLFSGSADRTLRGYDRKTGRLLCTMKGHSQRVTALGLRDDFLVSSSEDHCLRIWRLGHFNTNSIACFKIAKYGTEIYSGGEDKVILKWRWTDTGVRKVGVFRGHREGVTGVDVVSVLDEGKSRSVLVSSSRDGTCRVWDVVTGGCLRTLRCGGPVVCMTALDGVLYSGTAAPECAVHAWDILGGDKLREFFGHNNSVLAVYLVPSSDLLLYSASADRSVREWSVTSGQCTRVLKGHSTKAHILTACGDVLLSGSYDGHVRVWKRPQDNNTISTQVKLQGSRANRSTSQSVHDAPAVAVAVDPARAERNGRNLVQDRLPPKTKEEQSYQAYSGDAGEPLDSSVSVMIERDKQSTLHANQIHRLQDELKRAALAQRRAESNAQEAQHDHRATLAVLAAKEEECREATTRADELQQLLDRAETSNAAEVRKQDSIISTLREELESLRLALRSAQEESNRVEKTEAILAEERSKLEHLSKKNQVAAADELARYSSETRELSSQLRAALASKAKLTTRLSATEATLQYSQAEVASLLGEIATTSARCASLERHVDHVGKEKSLESMELEEQLEQLRGRLTQTDRELQNAHAQEGRKNRDIAALNERLAQAHGELDAMQREHEATRQHLQHQLSKVKVMEDEVSKAKQMMEDEMHRRWATDDEAKEARLLAAQQMQELESKVREASQQVTLSKQADSTKQSVVQSLEEENQRLCELLHESEAERSRLRAMNNERERLLDEMRTRMSEVADAGEPPPSEQHGPHASARAEFHSRYLTANHGEGDDLELHYPGRPVGAAPRTASFESARTHEQRRRTPAGAGAAACERPPPPREHRTHANTMASAPHPARAPPSARADEETAGNGTEHYRASGVAHHASRHNSMSPPNSAITTVRGPRWDLLSF